MREKFYFAEGRARQREVNGNEINAINLNEL
jgi:hypothetical protein